MGTAAIFETRGSPDCHVILRSGQPLKHGVSVTDACISFAQTVPVLNELAAAVKARRALA